MTTAKELVEKAKKQIGVTSYNNKCKYNTEYYGTAVKGDNFAWCCVFVWWLFKHLNSSSLFYYGKKTAYVPNLILWAKKKKLIVNKYNGKPGDIIIFDWNHDGSADHVGIVEKPLKNGCYTTIEGNTGTSNNSNGGKVMRRTRPKSYVLYIIRPKYKKVTILKKKYPGVFPELPLRGYLKQGNSSEEVKKLQLFLDWFGYNIEPDGLFGSDTTEYIKAFQRLNNLKVDGIVGGMTLEAMKKIKK